MLRHLAGEWTLEQAREETVRATKRFARRQDSWFRRDPRIIWLDAGDDKRALLDQAVAVAGPGLSPPGSTQGAAAAKP